MVKINKNCCLFKKISCLKLNLISFICCVILLVFIANFSSAATIEASDLEAFLDGVIYSQLDEHNIPGATLSVVKDGELLLSKGYGFANLENRVPVDPDRSLFRPGSVSKLFTWTAVMQVVEQGEIDLNDDINKYLDFKIPEFVSKSSNSETKPITMKHLMTHRPGFEELMENLFVLSEDKMLSLEEYLRENIPERVFPPGEIMAYSNYGSALAGYIVEEISGQSFEDYVEEHILYPLEMYNSTFRQPLPENLAADMTGAYKFLGGEYHKAAFEYIPAAPAGAMSTTASDMAKFMIAHLQNGRYQDTQILDEETAEMMHRQQFTHHPEIDGMALGFIRESFNGEQIISHSGGTTLFYSCLYLIPEHNIGLFVSYSGGTGIEHVKLFQAFMDRYFPKEVTYSPVSNENTQENALSFRGEYHPNRSNFSNLEYLLGIAQRVRIDVNADGYLLANFMGSTDQFVEIEEGLFQNRNTDGTQLINKLAFTNDTEGKTLLVFGGPLSYTIVPWYGSMSVLGLLTLLAIVLFIMTVISWTVSYIRRKLKKEKTKASPWEKAARGLIIAFALTTIIFFIGFIAIFANINPAYGVPDIVFNIYNPVTFYFVLSLPYVLAILTLAIFLFTILIWWKNYWKLGARLYYSLLSLSAFGLLWVLFYTNLI
ncbi:serine hydrolase domain-containing protein [Natronospora cellulosivora (SeqCode)]